MLHPMFASPADLKDLPKKMRKQIKAARKATLGGHATTRSVTPPVTRSVTPPITRTGMTFGQWCDANGFDVELRNAMNSQQLQVLRNAFNGPTSTKRIKGKSKSNTSTPSARTIAPLSTDRDFSIVASTGGSLVTPGKSRNVIDVAKCTFGNRLPVMIDHCGKRRIGYCTPSIQDNAIHACGDWDGWSIAAASMMGDTTWQASIGFDPESMESRRIKKGESETINGQTWTGQGFAISGKMIEVTLTKSPRDESTSVKVNRAPRKGRYA